jgi:superfamily II DNA or RNA helicase/HKD family nuclease
MKYDLDHLHGSLTTGFIDQNFDSVRTYRPELLLNDKNLGKKVLTTIEQELRTCDEFMFSVAFITTSGIASLKQTLKELEYRKVPGKILASQYLNFTQPEALRWLLNFTNIELKIVTEGDFHSKGYLFRKGKFYNLIIGSSNLTASALSSNKEWNLKVTATESSELIAQSVDSFNAEFMAATEVDTTWLTTYDLYYRSQLERNRRIQMPFEGEVVKEIKPNLMQREALENIQRLRKEGKNRALLISATGTGKTYLSAFDVNVFKPKKFLFVVHRLTIAKKAMETYKSMFGNQFTMGLYSGDEREIEADFIFSTIQTISKEEHLTRFKADHFDYIVIDETHRAGASSYQRIMSYFEPGFLLGMTATPERTDGYDVFKAFNYNIAYEIRLHRALEEEILSPFHYYGVADLSVNGVAIEDKSDFNLLTAKERVDRIQEFAEFYGCDDGNVRGLVFCSRTEEARTLSNEFNRRRNRNQHFYQTVALTGDDSEEVRASAIERLESGERSDQLDYIFTVDIFNEGIDIPKINQIIMLRPTQSAIIFVQQLGRGLRKTTDKEYLTVIDFIGNYANNYMVPIALYGDTSYNKDNLRNLISTGSQYMPGTSTIQFDRITKERIFKAIDESNLQMKKDLVKDYDLLKRVTGRIPMMMDFVEHGSRDPFAYVEYGKSYYAFIRGLESGIEIMSKPAFELLAQFSQEIANGKRIEELAVLRLLFNAPSCSKQQVEEYLSKALSCDYRISNKTFESILWNLNFDFIKKPIPVIRRQGETYQLDSNFSSMLQEKVFNQFFVDALNYGMHAFGERFNVQKFHHGFVLGAKYSRKDVCRILNWEKDISSTVYGYRTNNKVTPCFVTYKKSEDRTQSTQYNDHFIDARTFAWESRSNRKTSSSEIKQLIESELILLFVKKSDGEGADFYCLGEVQILPDSMRQAYMPKSNEPVVHFTYRFQHQVEDALYRYLVGE